MHACNWCHGVSSDTVVTADGYRFCPSCLTVHTVKVVGGGRCFTPNTVRSRDSREYMRQSDAQIAWILGGDGEWYVHRENLPKVPFEYHTDVFQYCKGPHDPTESKALIMGVELEMEARNPERQAQNEIVKRLNGPMADRYICTYDGSLDWGVEMVTLPYTLEEHKTLFDWPGTLKSAARIAKSGSGTRNCGMHVHVNRKALTPLQIGKMLVFLNHDNTNELVELVAQRRCTGFARKKEIRSVTEINHTDDISRYERLNMRPQHTVEFRIFKGNLRPERVLKNLEFVHATCEFAKHGSIREMGDPEAFITFIKKHRGTYENLLRFLQEKEYNDQSPIVVGRIFNSNKLTHKAAAPALEEI